LIVIYEGTLASDGTMQGTETVTSPSQFTQKWQGRIVKGFQSPPPPPPPGEDRLGTEWSVTEAGITGRWVRRGNSDTWDGTWANGAAAILTISIAGDKLRINRKDVTGGLTAIYEGTLASDGTMQGTETVTSPSQFTQKWQGRIVKGVQASTGDLGATLVVIYPGVCTAIWTRTQPGVYDSVTVCQGPGNASFRETLTVLSNESQTVIINRPKYGQYRGTLSADRRTIRGTCDWAGCTPNYRWTAYIDWNWNDAPPLR
jgi:hypothetical protein